MKLFAVQHGGEGGNRKRLSGRASISTLTPKLVNIRGNLSLGQKTERQRLVGWLVGWFVYFIQINSRDTFWAPVMCWVLALSLTSCVCTEGFLSLNFVSVK